MTDEAQSYDSDTVSLEGALEGSFIARTLRGPFGDDSRLADAGRRSRLAEWGRRLSETVQSSYLYCWLTKEPEPEVIVIDLRETWTVGPVIQILDRFVDWVTPYWRKSVLNRGLDGLVALGERATDTKYGRLLVKLLEPPEPPSDADDSDERADSQSTRSHDQDME